MKSLRTVVVRLLATAVTVGAVWIVIRGLDRNVLTSALRSARWDLLLLTSGLAVTHLCLRGIGWRVIMGPVPGASTARMVRYTIASAAASLLAPFRTGEALRPWLLRRNHGVPLTQSAGVVVADKLVEALGLALMALPLPLLGQQLPLTRRQGTMILVAVAAVLVIGFLGAGRRLMRGDRLGNFIRGIRIFGEPRRFALAVAVSLVAWLVDLAAIRSTLLALDIHRGLADLIVLLLTVNVALLLPSPPGNIGSLELGATLGAEYLGIAHSPAVAFALVYHAAQLAPLILMGAYGLTQAFVVRSGGKPRSDAPAPTSDLPPISGR